MQVMHSCIAVHVSVQHHQRAAVRSCIKTVDSSSVPFRLNVTNWEGEGVPPVPSPQVWSKNWALGQGGLPPSLPWRGHRGVVQGDQGQRGRTGSSQGGRSSARPPHQTRRPSGSALPPPSRPVTSIIRFCSRRYAFNNEAKNQFAIIVYNSTVR